MPPLWDFLVNNGRTIKETILVIIAKDRNEDAILLVDMGVRLIKIPPIFDKRRKYQDLEI